MAEVIPLQEQRLAKIIENVDLSVDQISTNPVIKPIVSIAKSWDLCELTINRDLLDYMNTKEKIDKMIEVQPLYLETEFGMQIRKALDILKNIIHQLNLEKSFIRNSIEEILDVVRTEYIHLKSGEVLMSDEMLNNEVEKRIEGLKKDFDKRKEELDKMFLKQDKEKDELIKSFLKEKEYLLKQVEDMKGLLSLQMKAITPIQNRIEEKQKEQEQKAVNAKQEAYNFLDTITKQKEEKAKAKSEKKQEKPEDLKLLDELYSEDQESSQNEELNEEGEVEDD